MRSFVTGAGLLLVAAVVAATDQSIDVGPSIAFSPSSVTVSPGDTVTWNWQGGPHSSTSNATSGPDAWDSGVQSTGATFSHTFNNVGSFPFYCVVHSSPTGTMMNGVVVVVAATTPIPTPPTVTPTPLSPTPTGTPLPPIGTPTPGGVAPIPTQSETGRWIFGLALAAAAVWLLARDRR